VSTNARQGAGRGLPVRRLASLLALVAVVVASAGLGLPGRASADQGVTLRVDPPSQTVTPGATFKVDIVQDSPVATTGVQLNLVFDPRLVRLQDFAPGAAYASGVFQFGSTEDGTNKSKAAAIAKANDTGVLRNVSPFLLPGGDPVPAGESVALTVTMEAVANAKGTSALEIVALPPLSPLQALDESSNGLPVTATGGLVGVGEAPVASAPPATATPAPSAQISPAGTSSLTVVPGTASIEDGSTTTIALKVATTTRVNSIAVDLLFNPKVLRVTSIKLAPGWDGAILVVGDPWQTPDQVIDGANGSGQLTKVGLQMPPEAVMVPPGDGTFAFLTVRGLEPGSSQMAITFGTVLDINGVELTSTFGKGELGVGRASSMPHYVLGAVVLLLLATLASGLIASPARRRRVFRRRSRPYVIALVLALVPVLIFLGITTMLVVNSLPAIERPGIGGLLGSQYSSRFSGKDLGAFGLLPALSGTVLIALVAILVALPVSMAMAIVITEFPMGPVGRVLRSIVEVLAGIPPILYAVSAAVFVTLIMIPKFAADSTFPLDPAKLGVDPGAWPPAGVPYNPGAYPWNPGGTDNSTLLGGAVVALLVIPFLTPLIADAIRNVPRTAREASLALGATHGHTLRKVILPMAAPGMVVGVALATLKAIGDTLIVVFAVGWEAQTVPNPIFDVLEKTSSLAAQGAGLLGAFQSVGGSCNPTECSVGYFSALLLLVVAAAIVLVMTGCQSRARRRMAA